MENEQKLKLNFASTITVGLAFMAICMFWDIYDTLMPLMLQNFAIFESRKFLVGLIMAADNVLALVLLPYMGRLSDNFKSRFGRRMPFIVVGSILGALLFLLLNLGHQTHSMPLLLGSAGFLLIAMSLYRTPAVALMPDVTPKPLRSTANAVINLMGAIGGIVSMGLSLLLKATVTDPVSNKPVLSPDANNWGLTIAISGIMLLTTAILILRVRENQLVEKKERLLREIGYVEDDDEQSDDEKQKQLEAEGERIKSLGLTVPQFKSFVFLMASVFLWFMAYNGCRTFFSTFSMNYLKVKSYEIPLIIGQGAGLAALAPAAFIAKKIGRKKTIMSGVAFLIGAFFIASVLVFALPKSQGKLIMGYMYVCFALVGIGWTLINVHSFVMAVEMSTKKNVGAFTGIYYTFSMSAQILTPVLVGLIADFGGMGLKLMFPYALVFVSLAFVTMIFVRHGNVKAVSAADEGAKNSEF